MDEVIRAKDLRGRAVVDVDVARKIGEVEEIVLDPDTCRVAGLVLSQGQTLLGKGQELVVPASAVHAIGPDALTVRGASAGTSEMGYLGSLPRLSHFVGRKMVTERGEFLGSIDDVLIGQEDGRIVGYAIEAARRGGLSAILGREGSQPPSAQPEYVRADADLRFGRDLIVVPDGAVVGGDWADSHHPPPLAGSDVGAGRPSGQWADAPREDHGHTWSAADTPAQAGERPDGTRTSPPPDDVTVVIPREEVSDRRPEPRSNMP